MRTAPKDRKPLFNRLLAKSSDTPDAPKQPETLQGHTAQVLDAAETLLNEVADDLLSQLGLDVERWGEALRRAVLLGAFLHDFGKANCQFQSMVRSNRNPLNRPQSIRHEALSGILCTQIPALRCWLCPGMRPNDELIFRAAICAAVGHHLKTGSTQRQHDSADFDLVVYLDHEDFTGLLRLGRKRLNLEMALQFDSARVFSLSEENSEEDSELLPELERQLYSRELPNWFEAADAETHRWLAAVKALVVTADVAGSALSNRKLPSQDESVKEWIKAAISDVLSAEELKQLVAERLSGHEPNPARENFQQRVESSPHRVTLVCAGCGAGKTAAAYRWAVRYADKRKLFFCYPTTGTASEGFKGYVSKSPIEGVLMHSRAQVDLASILGTAEDKVEVDDKGKPRAIPDLRLESLQAWSPPLVVCTVDTVLGLMQNNRRGLFSFPAFARAAFVFDEIHSYDRKLFGSLLRFLDTFRGAPVMLMTASLSPQMLAALEEVCGKLEPIPGPLARENAPRYRLRFVRENPDEQAWAKVDEVLKAGGKVLWIANTVDRVASLYHEAKYVRQLTVPIHLYHSRFRYFQRVDKHNSVVDAFDRKRNIGAVLAITTQVAEMSLDLSADLLVTDLAPPAALVQRLGRLNRDDDEPADTALALILECVDEKQQVKANPYVNSKGEPSEDFLLADKWLDSLPRDPEPVSQMQLAIALEAVLSEAATPHTATNSTWLDGEWKSEVDSLRASDFSMPIVLECDLVVIRNAGRGLPESERRINQRGEAIRRSLSIPGRAAVNGWQRLPEHGLFRIAPDSDVDYDEEKGARWR